MTPSAARSTGRFVLLALAFLAFLLPSPGAATERASPPRLELAGGEVVDLETAGLGVVPPGGPGELWPFVVAAGVALSLGGGLVWLVVAALRRWM